MAHLPYEPKIDGLRAISILLVILQHWLMPAWDTGNVGVTVFFVISGYLITGIIIKDDDSGSSLRARTLDFYWRRALRLFPPYYFCLLVLMIFDIGDIRQTVWWNATYTTNVEVALKGAWNGSSHFWSLAVEEQFYLAWFFLMAVSRGRMRMAIILFCLVLGPAFRAAMVLTGQGPLTGILLPGVADSLAAGALVCVLKTRMGVIRAGSGVLPLVGAIALTLVYAVLDHARLGLDPWWMVFNRDLVTSIGVLYLLAGLSTGDSPVVSWLNWGWLRHIGRVSYGVYIYHYFIPPLVSGMSRRFGFAIDNAFVAGLICIPILVVVVELSWRFIEQPSLRLKPIRPRPLSSATAA